MFEVGQHIMETLHDSSGHARFQRKSGAGFASGMIWCKLKNGNPAVSWTDISGSAPVLPARAATVRVIGGLIEGSTTRKQDHDKEKRQPN
jgi:hypothetical protein